MKKLLLLSLVGLFSFTINAQIKTTKQEIDPDAPIITFETQTVDYGVVEKGADGTREFKFTNTGKSPLKVLRVKATCGCTIPTHPKHDIMPGESGSILVKYDTKKIGRFSKSVSIYANTVPDRSVLRIKGEVVASNADQLQKKKNMLQLN